MHEIAARAADFQGGPSIETLTLAFYGPDGPLAQRGWEVRPMQREMSVDIARMIDEYAAQPDRGPDGKFIARPPRWGIAEAPCGTGKGLAYAVPGVLAAWRERQRFAHEVAEAKRKSQNPPREPRKMIISTANIALQEQLVRKDLPALAAMLGIELDVRLLKGRNNYLCRWKIRVGGGAMLTDQRLARVVRYMDDPACTGDREAMPFDVAEIWNDVSVTTEECLGQGCKHYGGGDGDPEASLCYWRQAIVGYTHAHVLVTNHHFLTLAKGMRSCLLAVDEMHELESSLRSTQARQLTEFAGRALVGKLTKFIGEAEAQQTIEMPVRWLMLEAGRYYDRAMSYAAQQDPRGKPPQDSPAVLTPGWLGEVDTATADAYGEKMEALADRIESVACKDFGCFRDGDVLQPPRYKSDDPQKAEDAGRIARLWAQVRGLWQRFDALAHGEPFETWPGCEGPWAIYVEKQKKKDGPDRTVAHLAPADVSWATAALAGAYPVAVLTSATVPDFPSLRLSLGLGTLPDGAGAPAPVYEKRLPSPYPLREMGVLVVPNGPTPKDSQWFEWVVNTVVDVVKLAGGGTLVLCSSTKMMWQYFKALTDKSFGVRYPVKVQGQAGRGELREWFKTNDDNGVLVATRSFFQGLDVQGDNCRAVIIDRVPFGRPDDPVENAVGQLLVERAGAGNAYMLRSVPEAAMVLAQGAGRLIRSQTDRGAVILLDNRVLGTGDGWRILRDALPPFPVSRDIADVENLLQRRPLVGLPPPPRGRSMQRRPSAGTVAP